MRNFGRWIAALAVVATATLPGTSATAHFILVTPPAQTDQDGLGDPQKTAPCGPNGMGTPTDAITTYQAGQTITITIDEKIPHPGHYRVALAVNDPSELPAAPLVTPIGNDECASTTIENPPTFPVLADGMLVHTSAFGGPQSFEVTLPDDVLCDNCTLQVLEYMSSHDAPCFYYHCATIAIQEEPVMTTATNAASSAGSGGANGSSNGASGTGGEIGGPNPNDTELDEGCSCAAVGQPTQSAGWGLVAFGAAWVLARTRRRR